MFIAAILWRGFIAGQFRRYEACFVWLLQGDERMCRIAIWRCSALITPLTRAYSPEKALYLGTYLCQSLSRHIWTLSGEEVQLPDSFRKAVGR